jgi:hypothetical protein
MHIWKVTRKPPVQLWCANKNVKNTSVSIYKVFQLIGELSKLEGYKINENVIWVSLSAFIEVMKTVLSTRTAGTLAEVGITVKRCMATVKAPKEPNMEFNHISTGKEKGKQCVDRWWGKEKQLPTVDTPTATHHPQSEVLHGLPLLCEIWSVCPTFLSK